jgi:hypothetical protein|tara:strand:+ start:46 stop:798 length:753 start_codon:yes stop_codon:yes gene_type:complete
MRRFNNFEKTILKELYAQSKNTEQNSKILVIIKFFVNNVLDNRALVIDNKQQIMTLVYDKENDENAIKEMTNFFSLIEYLRSNGLIISFKNDFLSSEPESFLSKNLMNKENGSIFPIQKKIKSNKNIPNFSVTFPKGFYLKIFSLVQEQIQLSSDIEHLIENEFLTDSDKSFKQSQTQTKISYIALFISFITLVISWYLSIEANKNDITIKETQIDKIVLPIKSIERKTDSILKIFNTQKKENKNKSEKK